MKRITTLLIALCAVASAYGQYEKGNFLVGGSIGMEFTTSKIKFDGNSTTDYKDTDFSVDPMAAIFVINNLAVGGALGFSSSTYKEDDDYKYVSTEITIEPMARYYLPQNIFFQARGILGSSTDKEDDAGTIDKDKYGVTGFSLGVGYAYFLGENVAVEPLVGYESKGYKHKDTDVKYVYGGMFLSIGFQIYLRK
jgi:hypothetical protein